MKLNYMQLLALPLAGLSFASTKPIDAGLVFEEKDGVVAVEAEHFVSQEKSDVRAWHIISTENAPKIAPDGDPTHANTASGGAYVEILPDTRRSHDDKLIKGENFTDKGGELAILTYPIHFNTPGRYYCWVRTFSTNTEDNGIHLGLNGTWPASGAKMQWTKKNQWAWDSKQRTQKVHTGVFGQIWLDIPTAGVHKIHFSMREDGFEFDKFLLTTAKPEQKSPPKGTGPATLVKEGKLPKAFKTKPASRFPKHWGAPPQIQTMDFVELPEPYGKGSSTLKNWILENQKKDAAKPKSRFPKHWGDPPKIQTRDLVPLPGNYGRGSSTLKNWILENQKKDAGKKANLPNKVASLPDLQQPRKDHGDGTIAITGAKTQWQPVNLTLDGPFANELDQNPNPFRDYSLVVTFTHSSGAHEYHVPGYFATDGNAGETSAKSGTKWRLSLIHI